jgi:hypothetical protein
LRGKGLPLWILLDKGISGVAGGDSGRFVRAVLPNVVMILLECGHTSDHGPWLLKKFNAWRKDKGFGNRIWLGFYEKAKCFVWKWRILDGTGIKLDQRRADRRAKIEGEAEESGVSKKSKNRRRAEERLLFSKLRKRHKRFEMYCKSGEDREFALLFWRDGWSKQVLATWANRRKNSDISWD